MKELKVPYLPGLDAEDLASAILRMETGAARDYIACVNWPADYPYQPIAAFDIARSATHLFLHYFVRGNSLKALGATDGAPVHKDSCVEFFCQREGEPHYMNFEFNCIGTCDAARRLSREEKEPLTPAEYASIRRWASAGHTPFAEQRGIHAWELAAAIPLTLMGLDPERLPLRLAANCYKCADETADPHFLSWNPIALPQPDFHCPRFFGSLLF